VIKMDKKMRGIADPFTLGLVIALLGSVTASNMTGNSESSTVQGVDAHHSSDVAMVALSEDEDE
jgi:hypothetical protein